MTESAPRKFGQVDFCVPEPELRALDQKLSSDPASIKCRAELAWHLRQRDPIKALCLAAEVRLAATADLPPITNNALIARMDLVDAEAHTLFARLDQAEICSRTALTAFEF